FDLTPPGVYGSGYVLTDIEFSKQNPGKVIVSTNAKDSVSKLWVRDMYDPSPSWQQLPIKIPLPYWQADNDYIVDFSVSGNDVAYLNMEAKLPNGDRHMMLLTTPIGTLDIDTVNTDFYALEWDPGISDFRK